MKTSSIVLGLTLLGAVGGGGYLLGSRSAGMAPTVATAAAASAAATAASATASAPKARKLLYYRNPMGLPDTSPTPKKDSMGMDYLPVYDAEDEAATAPGGLAISTDKVQKLGVRTEAAALRVLGRTVRAAGRVEVDERRVVAIAPRFEGYVETLHVNVTGQPVAQGQPLFEAYAPELVAAQRDYVVALQGLQAMKDADAQAQAGMRQLADASLARLRNWNLPPAQLAALVQTGQVQRTVSFPSPVAGIVTEKKALQGMRFMPGDMLYQVSDLSSVWVVADLAEQDVALVKPGARARVTVTAAPGQALEGRVAYIYPGLKAETRSVPVRVELANPGLRLKPAMYAQVELAVGSAQPVLSIPDSAVIDTGTRRVVLVQTRPGRFEPREVRLGQRGDDRVEVLDGVRDGEQVVVAANFLIDAESNLRAALAGLGAPAGAASAASAAAPKAVTHRAEGSVDAIDAPALTLSLNHGPVPTLKWPPMTMDFKVANASLLQGLKPGQAVRFEFVERGTGDYVVTAISAAPAR